MNKQLIPLMLLLLPGSPALAQELHLSGGYNASDVSQAGDEQWAGRPGYQFGADLLLESNWFLNPGMHLLVRELRYMQAGPGDLPAQEFRYTNRSLALPLMLGLN